MEEDSIAHTERKSSRAWTSLDPPLSPWVQEALSSLGFARMTPVQASTIPLFVKYKDVVVEVQHEIIHNFDGVWQGD